MAEAVTVSDIVSMSIGGDAKEVKSAIGDVLQQKITVALENKKKEIAQTFLTKPNTDSKEPESSEE
jgi:copper chaperone CopZ